MAVIARFAENTEGSDFIAGDIHGCFDQLETALERAAFNPEIDRCFSVGDLIDRGPYSPAALEWLDHPWFHACVGNHEEMALTARPDTLEFLDWILINGGQWWLDVDHSTKSRFTAAISNLPIAMEVATKVGHVGVVHADVPEQLSWPAFVTALERDDRQVCEIAVWGRQRASGQVTSGIEGIDRVVCGHTISYDRNVHIVGNVWLIDTGAFLHPNGHLTLLRLEDLFV